MRTTATNRSVGILPALSLALLVNCKGAPVAPPPLVLRDCVIPNVPAPARCGTLPVYENREDQYGRLIQLRVVVLPARDSAALPDPLFILVGGPGQSAVENAGSYARLFNSLHRQRALVFVDQRGTGGSNPLPCALYRGQPAGTLADFMPLDAIRSCRTALEQIADLRYYTSELAVEDLEEVRRAVGYPQINIDGGSYGTRVALLYLRRYPAQLRAVALRSVAPPRPGQLLRLAEDAQAALDQLAAACDAEAACHSAFPMFREEVAAVLARLDSAPARFPVAFDSAGPRQIELRRGPFAEKLRLMLYAPEVSQFVPLLIHRAARGDFVPFAELAEDMGRQVVRQLSLGMYLSVTCAEDVSAITAADTAIVPPQTLLGNYRVAQQYAACQVWPRGEVSREFAQPITAEVPVLLFSSSLDPITPPWRAAEVAKDLANSRHIVVPNTGHSPANRCVMAIEQEFFQKGSHQSLDLACLAAIHRPPFALQLP